MFFTYKGKQYDTARSGGELSTNQLQITEDNDLKLAVIDKYYNHDQKFIDNLLAHNQLDIIFDYVLTSARYIDIAEELSGMTKAGVYPDWIFSAVNERRDDELKRYITDIIQEADDDKDAFAKIKEHFYDEDV